MRRMARVALVLGVIILVFLAGVAADSLGQYFGKGGPTSLTSSTATSNRSYQVTFIQGPACGNSHITMWAVRLGNATIVEPSNVTLSQISETGYLSTSIFNLTRIVFSVLPGTYQFTIYPRTWLRVPNGDGTSGHSTGAVNVTSSDVIVNVDFVGACSDGV